MKCDAACHKGDKEAVVKITGDVVEGNVRRTVVLNLCAECAGPLLKIGEPVSMGCTVKERN